MKKRELVILVTGLPPINAASLKAKKEQRDEQIKSNKYFSPCTSGRDRWLHADYGPPRRGNNSGGW
jgi:hypothetical protein